MKIVGIQLKSWLSHLDFASQHDPQRLLLNMSLRSGKVVFFSQEVVMSNARRLWYWKGAASLSQLAMEGVSKPDENRKKAGSK